MCGRYVRRGELALFAEHFDFLIETPTPPAYNIACTDLADVVRFQEDRRRHTPMPWGLLPIWAKDAKSRTINARAETVDTTRMFRNAFEKRRCLILADGIIEWQAAGRKKLPHLFTLKGDKPFAFAGIWNKTRIGEKSVESCAIITTEANEVFARIHDRMPVVLQKDAIAPWLDPANEDLAALKALLVPYPAAEMTSIPISIKVNSARYKTADCLESAAPAASDDLFSDLP